MPKYIVDIFISGKVVFWIIVRPTVVIVIRRISFDDCNAEQFHHRIAVKGLLAPWFSFALDLLVSNFETKKNMHLGEMS